MSTYSYTYDSNGNMTKDARKDLNLQYNALNLWLSERNVEFIHISEREQIGEHLFALKYAV